MRAGRLCHRVELQRASESLVNGAVQKTWATIATVWAEVAPLAGREFFASQQVQSDISHRITMRYIPGVNLTPADRVKFGTRIFDISAVLNIGERNKEWSIQAVEHS